MWSLRFTLFLQNTDTLLKDNGGYYVLDTFLFERMVHHYKDPEFLNKK